MNVPVVTRIEYLLTDINDDDVNEDGSIVTLMTEGGETREDLRMGDGPEYKQLRDAFIDGSKEILVTVVNAMGTNRVGASGGARRRRARARRRASERTRSLEPTPPNTPPPRRADPQYATKEIGSK